MKSPLSKPRRIAIVALLLVVLTIGFVVIRTNRFIMAYFTCKNGNTLADQGNYSDAIADYSKAIAADPTYAPAYCNRGIALYMLGKPQEAIADFTKTITLDPSNAPAYNNRGLALDKQGKQQESIAEYAKAIEIDPTYALAYYNRGIALANLHRNEVAIVDYTRAIGLDPQSARAYNNRGVAFDDLGKHPEAIADLKHAISIKPDYPNAHINLAFVFFCGGETKECLAELNIADGYGFADEYKFSLSFLRLLATNKIGKDTKRLESEFANWLGGVSFNRQKGFEAVEKWLANYNLDAETTAIANGLIEKFRAKAPTEDGR